VAEARYHSRSRFPIEVVKEVGESLLEKETLDDYRCSTFWRHSRHVHRSKSAVAIKKKLTTKGTSVDIIETALEDFDDTISAHEAGFKFPGFLNTCYFGSSDRKLCNYLLCRGFSEPVIRCTIRQVWQGREDCNRLSRENLNVMPDKRRYYSKEVDTRG